MRSFWVLDSETDPFKKGRIPKPFVWGIYDGETFKYFKSTDEMIDFVKDRNIVIYAHNGGKFDYHFILDYLTPFDDVMIINGRLARFKIGKCEFRDSYNILPIPLKAYQKDDIDYNIMEADKREIPENWDKIINYLKGDCVYLWELIDSFISEYGFNLTLATSALKKWEQIADTKAPNTSKHFYNELKPYYYGGRVEVFKYGEFNTDFKVIDINSAYPYAMYHEHPYGDNIETWDELPETTDEINRSFITLEAVSRGAFPFRDLDGSLKFPNDNEKRIYHVTGWEYQTALKFELISDYKIHQVSTLSGTISFKSYIDHFFKLKTESKQNNDKAGYLFSKLFLNSLYGKFGANPDKYHEYKILEKQFIEPSEVDGFEFKAELGQYALMQKPLDEGKQRFYNVAVASSITGFVRAYLLEAIQQCKGVMYCDTDSIICESSGSLDLDPEKLGAWDIEAVCNYGAIAGKKLYAFKKTDGTFKTASKGAKLTPKQIIEVAKGNDILFEPDAPTFSMNKEPKFINRMIKKT